MADFSYRIETKCGPTGVPITRIWRGGVEIEDVFRLEIVHDADDGLSVEITIRALNPVIEAEIPAGEIETTTIKSQCRTYQKPKLVKNPTP